MSTTPTTKTKHSVDQTRALIATALERHAADPRLAKNDADLLEQMSTNVTGWTHTTRLREFLEQVDD